MQKIPIGKYRHNKSGNFYEVIGIAKHSETLEQLVVYKNLYEKPDSPYGSIWVRPLEMFVEIVELNGEKKPRFELIEELPK